MNFGQAIELLKAGRKVARKGWNGKSMFIYLVSGSTVPIEKLRGEAAEHLGRDKVTNRGIRVNVGSHIDMKAADGSIVVGWLASQTDMLAEDWEVVR